VETVDTVDYASAPKDYDEVFRIYFRYIVRLVHRFGIDDEHKEDVACDILARFMERDFLAKFDPTMVFLYEGKLRPARFKSFISNFVITYVRGCGDKIRRGQNREKLLCDRVIGWEANACVRWIDVYGGANTAPDPETTAVEGDAEARLVAMMRRHIATVEPQPPYDAYDLVTLFDVVIAQIRSTGHWDITELRHRFDGMSTTAMYGWLWWLRINLADGLARPAPTKRPRARLGRAVAA
jgi:hypothetical protein